MLGERILLTEMNTMQDTLPEKSAERFPGETRLQTVPQFHQ